jgi:Cu+-exporting ATPase
MTKKIQLKIEGMHCTSCAMDIDFTLEDIEGVKSAKTNFAKQITEVEMEESLEVEKLRNAIQEVGYTASII